MIERHLIPALHWRMQFLPAGRKMQIAEVTREPMEEYSFMHIAACYRSPWKMPRASLFPSLSVVFTLAMTNFPQQACPMDSTLNAVFPLSLLVVPCQSRASSSVVDCFVVVVDSDISSRSCESKSSFLVCTRPRVGKPASTDVVALLVCPSRL